MKNDKKTRNKFILKKQQRFKSEKYVFTKKNTKIAFKVAPRVGKLRSSKKKVDIF